MSSKMICKHKNGNSGVHVLIIISLVRLCNIIIITIIFIMLVPSTVNPLYNVITAKFILTSIRSAQKHQRIVDFCIDNPMLFFGKTYSLDIY